MTPARIGVAVIGSSGHAARVVAPAIATCEQARLAGVLGSAQARAQELADRFPGARAYAGSEELAADAGAQAVWIAGPNHSHVELASACLLAGKHVLLEKPMATSAAGAAELVALARESGLTLMVAFQHRFRPAHRWLRDSLASGLVGEVRLARVHRFWRYPYFAGMPEDPSGSWRSSLIGSGGWALNDIGSHLIDLALWLLGSESATLLHASTRNFKFEDAAAEDTALLTIEGDGGALITIETSNAMPSFPGTIEIHGAGGWVRAEGTFDGGGSIVTHEGERHRLEEVELAQPSRWALEDFLAAMRGEPAIGATAPQAALTVAIVAAAADAHRRRP
ncbi:MAG: Gfo/Idh/MocA family protein [Solirubrobacteraceae bacterium]